MTARTALTTTLTTAVVVAALVLTLALMARALIRERPQDLPWTQLDLRQPSGLFTGRKLTRLTDDFPACRAALDQAGARYLAMKPVVEGTGGCGYSDGLRMGRVGKGAIRYAPNAPVIACPVAAALLVWEREVVQPQARRIFGQNVSEIRHLGSYNCRRMYHRASGRWSEHSTADAVDIAGFKLADGTVITLVDDWAGRGERARFLRAVRDGACQLFATTLSPDYNAAHRDHFHFDQAERGAMGWRACR